MPGKLSTHALDLHSGKPAAGLGFSLFEVERSGRLCGARSFVTNADGRTDAPLLAGPELKAGTYQLEFAVGGYFRQAGVALPDPPFLDVVTVRFGISDTSAAYHVPLLFSPWAYSTYRGS